jgi:glycerol uptake facilitator-like aquaporin
MTGEWHSFWIYVVGPLVGALAGGLGYQAVRHPDIEEVSL